MPLSTPGRVTPLVFAALLLGCAGNPGTPKSPAGGEGGDGDGGSGGTGGTAGTGGGAGRGGMGGGRADAGAGAGGSTGGAGAGGQSGAGGGSGGTGGVMTPPDAGTNTPDALSVDAPAAPDSGPPGKGMRIYWIDVEGGAATLLVSPTDQTLLVDAGWSGARDRDRIVSVLEKEVGKKQLDYFVATHYHVDHVGGVGDLARAVPIMNFIDHGSSVEGGDGGYRGAIGPMRRMSVRPGDKINFGGVEITVVTASGQVVEPLPSARANPLCTGAQTKNDQQDEDPQSVGILARYGTFEFVDLGDLTWGVEHRLACPMNRLGQVEIFQSSQHGSTESNPPQLVHALAPVAIVVNNGASKGGSSGALGVFRNSPGLKDMWQVHHASGGGANNTEEALIANPAGGPDQAHWLRASVDQSGAFQITNGRTGMSRSYQSR